MSLKVGNSLTCGVKGFVVSGSYRTLFEQMDERRTRI